MVLTGLNRIEIADKPIPELLKSDEVLVRMKSAGVCGSDIHYYRSGNIGSQVVQFPFTLGHEGSGIIEKTGNAVKTLKPGDRVAIDPAMPCYNCDQCKTGRYHTCRNLKFLGSPGQSEGCLSEFIVIPSSSCFPIPENMTLDQAALSEPLAIALYAVRSAGPLAGKSIAILGAGPIGISVMLSAIAHGVGKVYMTDKIDERLALASEMGAQWTGNAEKSDIVREILMEEPQQIDLVFECCGQQEAADQAVELLKPGGRLMIIGIPSFRRWSFDVDNLRRKEISIQNVRRQNGVVGETIKMISDGRLNADRMQTHNFSLDDAGKAFELVAGYREGVMKAMIHI
ncbi:MAG: alcohol dehydrogenase catalytic domain-containing protein [Bacteroidales bacterium]